MEDTCETKTIPKDRHNSSGISCFEFMQCECNSIKITEKTAEHPDDYLP
jgi:hypothetical protein